MKIIILIPYFGRWPFWFTLFLKSCEYNDKIDWLFYTDCEIPEEHPKNTRFVSSTFLEYKERISKTLAINFSPESPYKLCDIKPALGLIHEKEIRAYDFWAFGDIDLIYGDLQGYLTPDKLTFDLISFHKKRVSGHLCLIRNTTMMNRVFKKAEGWQHIFESPEHQAFDEKQFEHLFLRKKHWPRWARLIRYFYKPLLRRSFFKEAHTTNDCTIPWVDGSFNFPRQWCWQKGELRSYSTGEQSVPYLHFLYWKRFWTDASFLHDVSESHDQWFVSQSGFNTASLELEG
jgi:hypothetical protein